jgi:hypothetical protein
MTIQLTKNCAKLHRSVGGKRHASDDDHEGPAAKRQRSPIPEKAQLEEDFNAEPVSSDDELHAPPPRPSRLAHSKTPAAKLPTPNPSDELSLPKRKSTRKENGKQASPTKSASKSQISKSKGKAGEDKKNPPQGTQESSNASASDDIFGFVDTGVASQQSNKSSQTKKTTFGKKGTGNFHVLPGKKPIKKPAIRVPNGSKSKGKNARKYQTPLPKEEDDSDVSTYSIAAIEDMVGSTKPVDPELRTVEKRPKKKGGGSIFVTPASEAELEALLDGTSTDKELKRASRRSKPTVLHDQLGDWLQDKTPQSSQLTSSAPQEDLDDLKDYLKELPEEEQEGSSCPLCRAPVESEDYWEYWKGKKRTVKHQNAFCRIHKTKSAWEEYRSEGYPDISWPVLPQRIRKHRMTLFKILTNELPSPYRAAYEPIALTGKAAAVPSRRKDLPTHIQDELDSYALDDQSTFPGYYGPHGRRVITETVMRLLKNEIKNCSDAVVQGSGPATFVQAVLVPETAILLIMEDCRVDREEAEEVRERTYEVGMLLHEEIEDRVEVGEGSEEENEYGAG